jgi:hypothetical protein
MVLDFACQAQDRVPVEPPNNLETLACPMKTRVKMRARKTENLGESNHYEDQSKSIREYLFVSSAQFSSHAIRSKYQAARERCDRAKQSKWT